MFSIVPVSVPGPTIAVISSRFADVFQRILVVLFVNVVIGQITFSSLLDISSKQKSSKLITQHMFKISVLVFGLGPFLFGKNEPGV